MSWAELLGVGLMGLGAVFFVAGTVGILRFPDVFSRLHAVTKADNLGLGLVAAGTGIMTADGFVAAKLALVWLLIAVSGAIGGHLIARHALRDKT
ncbi:monovalent cation/H(+) antiporter subunit G [Tateyamaria sp. ANG-S1]|uniref:cation:proton antiporter n=1 Tax=Tateyamaria sp. ANG-S1 TaxID=1577905 RepID=UPI00057CD73B|nr:monovalent cation/H(+) antiporter subunit G [Tateyamaria sp. ANG-S1]KIC48035.1 cation:proton antiporter [Tateyamaria sp. ANG-S1]